VNHVIIYRFLYSNQCNSQ